MKKNRTFKLTLLAMLAAMTFVLGYFTKVPIPGGYFTLLDAGIFATAMLLGKKEGFIVGALAGFLNDLLAGYAAYMFFTLIIHGLQGYTGVLTKSHVINYLISGFIMVGGYFIADMIIAGTLAVAIPDLFINTIQTTAGYIVALIVTGSLRKSAVFKGRA